MKSSDMTAFVKGQVVRARESVQGMTKGVEYRVVDLHMQSTAFGQFVTYGLTRAERSPLVAENRPLFISNGHLLLEAAVAITITNLTEDEVTSASAMLDERGFEYDVDYTTWYGPGWAIIGLHFKNTNAAALVLQRYVKE